MRRALLLVTALAVTLVVASGVAWAATINGTNHADRLRSGVMRRAGPNDIGIVTGGLR
jgi:hypothetical protein